MALKLFKNEDEAREALARVERELGWRIRVFTKEDVERIVSRPLSDDQWARLTQHPMWLELSDRLRDAVACEIERIVVSALNLEDAA